MCVCVCGQETGPTHELQVSGGAECEDGEGGGGCEGSEG